MNSTLNCLLIFFISFCFLSATAMPVDSLMNVKYGNAKTVAGKEQSLSMNIYFPGAAEGKKHPLVMLMHGGGFIGGSKDAMKAHCRILADSGFIAVTIDYRKGWDAGANPIACEGKLEELQLAVYRATQDARAALRFLVEKQQEYSIDTAWLFVGGSSAGGVLALNTVYLTDTVVKKIMREGYKALGGLDNATNNYATAFTIKGICNMWGALPDSTLITPAIAVPTILFHGSADYVVPYDVGRYGTICDKYPLMYGSACVYRKTLAAGKPAVLNTAVGGNHGPKEFYSKIAMSNTACFFKRVMEGTATSNSFTNAKAGCRN